MAPITPQEILDLFDRSMPKRPYHMFHGGKCIFCGQECSILTTFDYACIRPSKEWVKLFLEQWNKIVKLFDNGRLFQSLEEPIVISGVQYPTYTLDQNRSQREYAQIAISWLIPNDYVEPHVMAYDISPLCTCNHCRGRK